MGENGQFFLPLYLIDFIIYPFYIVNQVFKTRSLSVNHTFRHFGIVFFPKRQQVFGWNDVDKLWLVLCVINSEKY